MSVPFTHLSPADFARSEFAGCAVGDPRRQARVETVAAALAASPKSSIPTMFCGDSYGIDAAYNLFKRKEATPDNLQSTHRRNTLERCSRPGEYLHIEDTTDMSFSGGEPIEGLGPIGDARARSFQGFRLHSVLAVRVPDEGLASECSRRGAVELCGLLDQQSIVRPARPRGPRKKSGGGLRERAKVEMETDRWPSSVERAGEAPKVEGVRWVRIADCEGDFYEYLVAVRKSGSEFVVRAWHDRRMQDPESGKRCGHLLTEARKSPSLGAFELHLRKRGSAAARTATLCVSVLCDVLIQSPRRPGRTEGALAPVRVTVVRVWEANPPKGCGEPLEWLLLTSLPVADFAQARAVALRYSCRWIIEEFHKALKSGMNAEKLQLEHGSRLVAAISVMSVVALRLVDMRERARLTPDAPAVENGFDPTDLLILGKLTRTTPATLREAVRAVAKLGGFMGRKGDGEPGMITLWRGMTMLNSVKKGYLLAKAAEPEVRSQE